MYLGIENYTVPDLGSGEQALQFLVCRYPPIIVTEVIALVQTLQVQSQIPYTFLDPPIAMTGTRGEIILCPLQEATAVCKCPVKVVNNVRFLWRCEAVRGYLCTARRHNQA